MLSARLSLSVDPPTIVRRTSTQILNETGELRLKCYATGNPRPFITWTKVPDPTTLDSPDGVLTIYKANKTHSGIYQCRASNGVGRDATALSSVRFNCKFVFNSFYSRLTHFFILCYMHGLPRSRI